jgi:uncharacterized protein
LLITLRSRVDHLSEDAIALVKRAYDALSRRDLEMIATLAAPDVELVDPDLPGGGAFHGREGIRQFVKQWLEAFEELVVEVEDLVPVGGRIVACLHQHGRSTSGVPVELRDAHVWTIVDGRVSRVELYLTYAAARAAATDT